MANITPSPVLALNMPLAQAGNGNSDFTLTRPMVLFNAYAQCSASQSGGTTVLTVQRQAGGSGSFTAVSAAMTFATADAITRSTSMAQAQVTCGSGDVLRCVVSGETGGSTANGKAIVLLIPSAIPGNG